jgi:hypothetical protein
MRERAERSRPRSRPVSLVTVTLVAGLVTVLTGVAALAVSFGDVPANHPHAAGIEFMRESGVTIGCGDGTNYCPADAVNRGQMGTFMHRLSGNAPGTAPSVDAATVMGLGPDDLRGEAGVIARTIITYTEVASATPGGSFEKVRDLGTFEKDRDDSTLRLSLTSHGRRVGGFVCNWQVRVDDDNRLGDALFDGTEATLQGTASPLHIESYFDDVDAGERTVSLWVRGVDDPECIDNSGNYPRTVVVEELPPL